MKKFLIFALLIMILVPAAYSLTAAVGNAKAIIRVNASPEDPAILDRTLKIQNKNDIPVIVTILPGATLRNFITLEQDEYVLQPGEAYNVPYTLTIDRGGSFSTVLNVGYSPEDPESRENNVGMVAQLTIISEGPEIPFPGQEEEAEEEETVEEAPEEEVEEEQEETEEVQETNNDQNEEAEEETGASPVKIKSDSGASPLVGIGIIVVVIVVGLGLFFAFARKQ